MQPYRTVLWICLLGLCSSVPAWAQPAWPDPCQPLRALGPIPADFLIPYTEVYQQAAVGIEARFPRQKRLQQAYYRESLYHTHQLLLGGRVLFHDSVSQYIAAVADHLLRTRPELRSKLRFYAVRSPAVNAFASGNGIILVNVGLIAQLDNEAQLAFILSHEIAHYVKQHALEIFLQTRKGVSDLRNLEQAEQVEALLLRQNLYSREAEMEADHWGTRLYLSSGYDLDAIEGAFAVLRDADRPLATELSTVPELLPNGIHLQAGWLVPPPEPGYGWQPGPASLGTTHPAPAARLAAVRRMIEGLPTGGRPVFFLGEARFRYIRDRCRFATCRLYLAQRRYEYALLGLRDLLQRHPQHIDLHHLVAYAWYGLARHANVGRFFDVHQPYFNLRGGARHLTWLTEQLSPAELTVMALLAAWQAHQQQPEAPLLAAMTHELGHELLSHHLPAGEDRPLDSLLLRDSMGLASTLAMQPELLAWLAQLRQAPPPPSPKRVWLPADRRQMNATQRQLAVQGVQLGLDRVVFVNPGYQQIDERLLDPVLYVASEQKREQFAHTLTQMATDLGLSHQVLDVETLDPPDIASFHDLALLSDWRDFYDQQGGVSLLSPFHDEMLALCQRYQTSHFVWLNCYTFTRNRVGKPLVLAAGFLFPPLLPYSFYYVFTPRYDTVLILQAYDLTEHTYRLIYPRVIRMRDRPDVVQGHLYDLLLQLK